ncbi:MAG TPA: hypothetical protein VES20_21355, partial [Bryobacteraceae bacterium]|nr:hypothetical protein [Bryobacteraceae bacterium]
GTVLGRLGPVTVTASTSGSKLGSATWTVAGPQRFEAPLAPGRVPDVMAFEFSLDKFFRAGEVDERELGLVVRQVGLEIR